MLNISPKPAVVIPASPFGMIPSRSAPVDL